MERKGREDDTETRTDITVLAICARPNTAASVCIISALGEKR